jgi:uroporphyrin-3 C-methyltransferase
VKEDENTQEPGTEADSVSADSAQPELPAPAPAAGQTISAVPPQRSNGLAWLALLLSLAALGLGFWIWRDLQQSVVDRDRLQGVGQEAAANRQSLQQMQKQSTQMRQELESGLAQQIVEQRENRDQQFTTLQAALQSQRQQLLELRSTDRTDWSLAEAEYLLRLAHQRLLMADDARSALALLSSADAIIVELDDADLHVLRAAIASDAAALRAIPEVDIEGLWLRIRALGGTVDELLLFELPEREISEPQTPVNANWKQRLDHGFRSALQRLSSYVVIRRRDAPYKALMDPQWEQLVRQNLRMLLEQSQSALMSGNDELYRQSLTSTRRWLGEFFAFNESSVAAMDRELEALLAVNVARDYPGVNNSLSAMKMALNNRHAAPDVD